MNVKQFVELMKFRHADKTAFSYFRNNEVKQVTYGEFVTDIFRYVNHLYAIAENPQDKRFGILARNSYEYMVCLLGTVLSGGIVVPLNVEETEQNILYQLSFAEVDYLFADGTYAKRHENIYNKYSTVVHKLDEYLQASAEMTKELTVDEDKLAMLLFTSGTTGISKAVMINQANIFSILDTLIAFASKLDTNTHMPTVRVFLMNPMYHVSGIASAVVWLFLGAQININSEPKYLYRDLQAMPSDHALIVPMVLKMFIKELEAGRKERLGGIKVITSGAATVDEDLLKVLRSNGIAISQGYGMTEIFGGAATNDCSKDDKLASVGTIVNGVEIKIVDQEICLRGKGVMMGYYKMPEETEDALKDGWYHTGDLGYLDEDGYLFLTGRKKNLIILDNGENVSPEELEKSIMQIEGVEEVVVLGKNGKIAAQIYAPIADKENINKSIDLLNSKQSFYKKITDVVFVEAPFAKTATGKIIR